MFLRHTTISTSLEFNMKPENQPLEKEIPFGFAIIFRFYSLNFAGITGVRIKRLLGSKPCSQDLASEAKKIKQGAIGISWKKELF